MSIIQFGSQKVKKESKPMITEALEIIEYSGADVVHDRLGRRYFQGLTTLKGLKEARKSIGLVLAVNE